MNSCHNPTHHTSHVTLRILYKIYLHTNIFYNIIIAESAYTTIIIMSVAIQTTIAIPDKMEYMEQLYSVIEDDCNTEIYFKYKIENHKDMDNYKYGYARVYRVPINETKTVVFYVIDDPNQEFIILEYNKNELVRGFLYSEHVKHYYEDFEYEIYTTEQLNTYPLDSSFAILEKSSETDCDYEPVECFNFYIRDIDDF
jgi:hypothetical protein